MTAARRWSRAACNKACPRWRTGPSRQGKTDPMSAPGQVLRHRTERTDRASHAISCSLERRTASRGAHRLRATGPDWLLGRTQQSGQSQRANVADLQHRFLSGGCSETQWSSIGGSRERDVQRKSAGQALPGARTTPSLMLDRWRLEGPATCAPWRDYPVARSRMWAHAGPHIRLLTAVNRTTENLDIANRAAIKTVRHCVCGIRSASETSMRPGERRECFAAQRTAPANDRRERNSV
jgi:hypothetical protein